MSRPLVPGLVAEGDTDEHFLGRVISRQLRALTDMSPRPVDVQGIQYGACRMTKDDKGIDRPVVPLVPVKETESWLVAGARVWGRVPGADTSLVPAGPRGAERSGIPLTV
jgi:hypothetical protein